MKKIAIVGAGGSGKSTLARELGLILGLPVIHLDALNWKPGWVETPKPEWRNTIEKLVRGDAWIIDGNYGGTMDIRLSAADTIIFLDFPRAICLWRVLKRVSTGLGRTRPDMAPGCPEKFSWDFIKWVWDYPKHTRLTVIERIERYSASKRVHMLQHPAEVRDLILEIGKP